MPAQASLRSLRNLQQRGHDGDNQFSLVKLLSAAILP